MNIRPESLRRKYTIRKSAVVGQWCLTIRSETGRQPHMLVCPSFDWCFVLISVNEEIEKERQQQKLTDQIISGQLLGTQAHPLWNGSIS